MIKTIKERVEKLKKFIAGVGLVVIASAGALTGDYYLTEDIDLMGEKFTKNEYNQIKKEIGKKGSEDNLDYNGLQLYVAVLNIEKEKCGGKMYPIINKQDIRDLVKKFDNQGCPK